MIPQAYWIPDPAAHRRFQRFAFQHQEPDPDMVIIDGTGDLEPGEWYCDLMCNQRIMTTDARGLPVPVVMLDGNALCGPCVADFLDTWQGPGPNPILRVTGLQFAACVCGGCLSYLERFGLGQMLARIPT